MPELALCNEGGGVAVVLKISGKLRSKADGAETNLRWTSNLVTEFLGKHEAKTFTRFESYPSTMFVSKSEAAIKRIEVESVHPFNLPAGDYDFELKILARSAMGPSETRRTIRIRPQDERFLEFHRPKKGESKEIYMHLQFDFDHELKCYVSRLASDWTPVHANTPSEGSVAVFTEARGTTLQGGTGTQRP
jgi:hypothetical protein